MANLTTRFFGLELTSPVIAASCSMTGNAQQIKRLADAGAGAIVLKSIFEEEIYYQLQEELSMRPALEADPEYLDYFDYVIKDENLKNYIRLIADSKAVSKAPIVASINCLSAGDWIVFSRKLEEAGADALELNLFIMPSDPEKANDFTERFYLDTIRKVKQTVSIPVTVKIGHYFSNLSHVVQQMVEAGVDGITLFNRFYAPDIDIDHEKIMSASIFSSADEYLLPLRWAGILSAQTNCPLATTTGIHNGETAVKMLLAGASAVQVATILYQKGAAAITEMNQFIADWMDNRHYKQISDFKGRLNNEKAKKQAAWERAQFMKYFGEMPH